MSPLGSTPFGAVTSRASGSSALALATLMIAGCHASDVDTYTRLEIRNPDSQVRTGSVVEVPLERVRARYPAFYEDDFSVHRLSTTLYAHGDPMMALDPPPELPSQLVDRDLDGRMDTLLVSVDLGAGDTEYLAIASPRFSNRIARPESSVVAGIWESGSVPARRLHSVVVTPGVEPAAGRFLHGGVAFETDDIGYAIELDAGLRTEVLGKRLPERILESMAEAGEDVTARSTASALLGPRLPFGAGALAVSRDDGTVEPLGDVGSIQCRIVASGPVSCEVEFVLTGVRMGDEAFDVKWQVSQERGSRVLHHRATVSRTGHRLAFAAANPSGLPRERGPGQTGWLRTVSYAPARQYGGIDGSVGIAIVGKAAQSIGFIEGGGAMGVRFDPMLRSFQWKTLASWSEEPNGDTQLEQVDARVEQLLREVKTPAKIRNLDFPGT